MSDPFSQKHRVEELRYVSAERRLEVAFEDDTGIEVAQEVVSKVHAIESGFEAQADRYA